MQKIKIVTLPQTKATTVTIKKDAEPYYYGNIKNVSSNNDISYITRGAVYFLRDNPRDPDSKYHPYLVIQKSYLDKIGKITVFGITSTPASINMIPIIMKDAIGYIDWHQPYIYKISEFHDSGTRYIGNIANQKVIDIATNLYGLYLGMNLNKNEDEIIQDYLDYVDEFKERSKNYKPYNETSELTLHISFKRGDNANVDDVPDDIEIDDTEENIIKQESECFNTEETGEMIISIGQDIEIELQSQTIQSSLAALEDLPEKSMAIPSDINEMKIDEIKIFLSFLKFHSQRKAAKLYNTSQTRISCRKRKLEEMYNIVYV